MTDITLYIVFIFGIVFGFVCGIYVACLVIKQWLKDENNDPTML